MKTRFLVLVMLMALIGVFSGAVLAQNEETYISENGLFSVPVPAGWTLEEDADGVVSITSPDGGIVFYMYTVDGLALNEENLLAEWQRFEPEFAYEPAVIQDEFSEAELEGLDDVFFIQYDGGQTELIQGVLQSLDGVTYVLLIRGEITELQRLGGPVNVIATGYKILGLEETDLSGVERLPVTDEVIAELEPFIELALELAEIPGASLAIIDGDDIVYANGFGVIEQGNATPVNAQTLMPIASTTKTMTTMAMATLVDEGLITWDEPVVDILPNFAVADPEITQTLTVSNLVCACSGVPRRDLELIFNYEELTAEDVMESLATFEFFSDFGEAFQYSNQMVAAGGYAAAVADGAEYGDLYNGYVDMMQRRILDPIGMDSSTFDFDAAVARGNYALPHGSNLDGDFIPIPLADEAWVEVIAPAGGLWSNVEDMGRYVITALNRGVTPEGERIVSEENLLVTWTPQVSISANDSYGLGWIISTSDGLQVLSHDGNLIGYSSTMIFLPEADLGFVMLSNGRATNGIHSAVFERLMEILFEQDPRIESLLRDQFAEDAESTPEAEVTEVTNEPAPDISGFVGDYTNDVLGDVSILEENGDYYIDAGEWRSLLSPQFDDDGVFDSFYFFDPPLTGVPMEFVTNDDGTLQLNVGVGLVLYTFTPAE
ncbi:MAG: serine hydrolase domain-containing protein [Aggregatilineales bacterium]